MRHLFVCVLLCAASHFALDAAFGQGSEDPNRARTGSAFLYPPKDREVRMARGYGSRVIVSGAKTEDAFGIDYRNGKWFLRRSRPGAH